MTTAAGDSDTSAAFFREITGLFTDCGFVKYFIGVIHSDEASFQNNLFKLL